ncbi:hypothetical protein ASG87_16600 [Frateuria sp. Soil773]|uniref:M91 family zinc metallopeptidase n=1 Tax=Frateuria sp. Soil773 TaxID=1736407 RepID=UPI0007014A65|nr:M91 family zinc metallopeptidase [Frateuria sp. Soil773]KRE96606.1 hypothetical protein ASG87_16600 [Frateuria sp. Soil773]
MTTIAQTTNGASQGYWNPLPATEGTGSDLRLATRPLPGNGEATRIDGNATNGGRQTTRQTTDGKTIQVDPFQQNANVSIQRERTLADAGRGQRYVSSDQLVFTTGGADDQVQVANNRDGSVSVKVNGEDYQVELAQGQTLTFRTGDGNDTVAVASDVKVNLIVDAGAGDDTVSTGAGMSTVFGGDGKDAIVTGSGDNYVEAGDGDDKVTGGSGHNIIYGGDGNDELAGGNGGNFIDGGAGNDTIAGGTGKNILSGGDGDDAIDSHGGTSAIYAGAGKDSVSGGKADTVYAKKTDDLGGADGARVVNVAIDPSLGAKGLKVEGSDAFRQRVEADIAFLRASPAGQQMLAEYDKAAAKGNTVTIRELQNEDNGYTMPSETGNGWADTELVNGRAGKGDDAVIAYNPSFRIPEFPAPVGVLYHEMSHAYDAVNGVFQPGTYDGPDRQDADAGVPNSERQAVGLDNTGTPYDFDGDPSTPRTTANPFALTENGLRAEMGLDPRLHYAL